MTTMTTTPIFPDGKGATPTLLARRFGMGQGRSDRPAEWPGKVLSDHGRKPEAAECVLGRLGDLVRHSDEHVPKRTFSGNRDERQPVALLARDGKAGGFSPLVNEGVGTVPGGLIPGLKANDRHFTCLS
jgi:hypothetical protein